MTWTIDDARKTYGIREWSEGYFDIDSNGHIVVFPMGQTRADKRIDLVDIIRDLENIDLSTPVLIRFTDILCDRVKHLQIAFDRAAQYYGFTGNYRPVYPIKVNQQRRVIEGITKPTQPMVGLEVGSKAELMGVLALNRSNLVICNGYKDTTYLKIALIASRLGWDIYIVIEKLSELDLLLQQSDLFNISPMLGVRIKLNSVGAGNWQNSGGEKSKFGLNPSDLLTLIDKLRSVGKLDGLSLMHFHIGSQISNINDLNPALKEASRHYAELRTLGVPIQVVDVGGGLGVDYEGTRSRSYFSMNYTVHEYVDAVIKAFSLVCAEYHLPHPDIVTEAGRAMTAHHAVLVTHVSECQSKQSNDTKPNGQSRLFADAKFSLLDIYHNARSDLQQANLKYIEGKLDITELAQADRDFIELCLMIQRKLNLGACAPSQLLNELNERLADKIFCNFSLFQSMPDAWGIQQIFPIMPLQYLHEQPTRRGVLHDLTCDSDGTVKAYIDTQKIEKTIPIHEIRDGDRYFIGIFLVGAYQEVLGDMHNLFGDTHAVNIELSDDGDYHLADPVSGDRIGDILKYIHIDPQFVKRQFSQKLLHSSLSPEEYDLYYHELCSALIAYSYLES